MRRPWACREPTGRRRGRPLGKPAGACDARRTGRGDRHPAGRGNRRGGTCPDGWRSGRTPWCRSPAWPGERAGRVLRSCTRPGGETRTCPSSSHRSGSTVWPRAERSRRRCHSIRACSPRTAHRPPKPPPPPPPPEEPPPEEPPDEDQLELDDELLEDPARVTGVAASRPIEDEASESDREETASNSETRVDTSAEGEALRITPTHSFSMPNSTAYGSSLSYRFTMSAPGVLGASPNGRRPAETRSAVRGDCAARSRSSSASRRYSRMPSRYVLWMPPASVRVDFGIVTNGRTMNAKKPLTIAAM